MPIDITMPALSPTMTEGTLAKWLKKEGDKIKSGDVIAEIETDKATMEVEAVDEGILGKILVQGGTEGVAVNKVIAVLLADGEDAKSLEGYAANDASPTSAKKDEAANDAVAASKMGASQPSLTSAPQTASNSGARVFASPLAKRVAANAGLDIARVKGTGPHGRVIRADVEEAMKSGGAKSSASTTSLSSGHGYGRNPVEQTEIPLNTMRKVIAKRLLESKQTIPHFYLSVDCKIDDILKARAKMNESAPKVDGKPLYKLTVNDFVIKASALALRDVPAANSSWTDSAIIQYNNVDVSVAVAIDGGLITPIVRNADQKSLSAISLEMKDLASRAKENKLKPEEFQGGGFSISNLGMYGVKQFNAIINPPQSAILAVGASEERVVVEGGQMKVANIMTVTLSSDHRVVDGAVGAEFLAAFKRYIEDPMLMLV